MRRRRTDMTPEALRVLMTLDAVEGVWRYGMDLARALKPRGVEFVFLVLGPAPTDEQTGEAEAIGELIHMPLPLDWLSEAEGELTEIPAAIEQVAEDRQVDLIHLNRPTQAAGLQTGRPVIVMSHACVPTWFQAVKTAAPPAARQWHASLNRAGMARADLVIVPSRSHAELVVKTYGQVRNLRVVHNATGSITHTAHREGREGVVAVGRWWDEAANGAVIDQAAARMTRPLTMIGSNVGPNGEHLRISNATHAGSLSHAETLALVGKAEVFVSPSLYEPFGLAALDAAASRTPLVLADIPTYRELWDGAALFVPPRDPAAYVEATDKLLNDRQLREILAQLASNRATRFTPVRQAAAIRAVYDSLAQPALSTHAG